MALEEVVIFDSALGLNNVTDRAPKGSLTKAENVIITPAGELVSRRGILIKESGSFSSLFNFEDYAVVVKKRANDYALFKVDFQGEEVSLHGLRSGLTKPGMSYAPAKDTLYYTNSVENGVIKRGQSFPWPTHEWPAETKTVFEAFPVCDKVAYLAGRIYGSKGNVLHYSLAHQTGLHRPKQDWVQYKEGILEIIPAADGLYVSTEKSVYFLSGFEPEKWQQRKVLNYPVCCKSSKPIETSFLGLEPSLALLGASSKGPVALLPGGNAVNLVDKQYQVKQKPKTIFITDNSLIIQE